MKKLALFIGFFLLTTPAVTLAANPSCSAQGYTVVYVNGIFDTKSEAEQNRKALENKISPLFQGQSVIIKLGYNPTHLAGAGDLVQTAAQLFNKSVSSFDLNTILLQIYPEVTTRKLLLVGHSQGSFYTNDMYYYLLSHGEPDSAVAVYNVASPAAYTAGRGKYINSSGDTLLNVLRSAHFDVLPNNADLVPTGADGDYSGHAFAEDYLQQASTQMLADMDGELGNLQSTDASATGDCFTPPTATLGYKATAAAFAVADPSATVIKAGTVTVVHASEVALAAASKVAIGALQLFSDSIVITAQPPSDVQKTAATEKIINKLYGSSVDGLSPEDKRDLLGSSQGASALLAVTPPKAPAPKGLVLGTSTEVAAASTTLIIPKSIFPSSSNGPVWSGGGGASPTPVVAVADIEPAASDIPTADDTAIDLASTTGDMSSTTPADPVIDTPPVVVPATTLFNDNFDSYDGTGWATNPINPNGTYVNFGFDDGSTGNCRSGGCLTTTNTGSGGLGGGGHVAYMFKDTGVGGLSGAYSIWGIAHVGLFFANGSFSLCTDALSGCGSSQTDIDFSNILSNDNTWHQYYIAWRQGSTTVQYCFAQDDTNNTHCTWNDLNFPLGTGFDAIKISGFSSRADYGDTVRFDDLEALSTPQ